MTAKVAVLTTKRERGIVALVRFNDQHPTKYVYRFGFRVGSVEVRFQQRRRSNLWGRFGGGWDWKLGAQLGPPTLILFLFVMSITIARLRMYGYRDNRSDVFTLVGRFFRQADVDEMNEREGWERFTREPAPKGGNR